MSKLNNLSKSKTRRISVGNLHIGGGAPIVVQSMCATKTQDIKSTLAQIDLLSRAGAGLIRLAADSSKDALAIREISKETDANLVVDLQENYRLAEKVAPFISKFRYNPGHLFHHQRNVSVEEKVKYLVNIAGEHDCAIRIGVNFGSIDPELKQTASNSLEAAIGSALEHAELMDKLGFSRFVVSLKSSNPSAVVEINKRFSKERSDVPLHLGVTEAGLLPDAEIKTRMAFEQLLAKGIGDTVRVSLTLTDSKKDLEVLIARQIIQDVESGQVKAFKTLPSSRLDIVSCPSCSRVENNRFVDLAQKIREATEFAKEHNLTIAVMGCRVNGPGETDDADFGLWCAPNFVNLKKKTEVLGAFSYDEVIPRLLKEINLCLEVENRQTES